MLSNDELYRSPDYWLEEYQNRIYFLLKSYMTDNNLNQTELAKKLGYSKGYISQILNGNFNYSLKKLIDFSLKLDFVPELHFTNIDRVLNRKVEGEWLHKYNWKPSSFDFNKLNEFLSALNQPKSQEQIRMVHCKSNVRKSKWEDKAYSRRPENTEPFIKTS